MIAHREQLVRRKVAIVGAGPTGIVALKECLAEGHEAVAFEARPEIGGQWAYQPVDASAGSHGDVWSSMYDSAELNSCRDTTSYGDFPIDPARYEQYFGHAKMLRYLNEYADHFDLRPHIKLETRVVAVDVNDEGTECLVHVKRAASEHAAEEKFDAVLVCSGHLSNPVTPEFKGREVFEGELGHSHFYRKPEAYRDKKVVLIGQGSSAIDIAADLVGHAKEVHLLTRRGGWVIPKWVLGKPAEAWDNRASQIWVPLSVTQWLQTKLLNLVVGAHPPSLQPDHKILEQSASCQQTFMPLVKEGKIKVHRTSVSEFTSKGMKLGDGTLIDDVDAVIACTGYKAWELPFKVKLGGSAEATNQMPRDLYKMIVSRPPIYYLGFLELFGPHLPSAEAQGRWTAAVLSGRIELPDEVTRNQAIEAHKKLRKQRFVPSERHDLAAYAVEYIDDLLQPLGAVPTSWTALKKGVWNAVFMGVTAAAQWRLAGHGANEALAEATVRRVVAEKKELSTGEVEELKRQHEKVLKDRQNLVAGKSSDGNYVANQSTPVSTTGSKTLDLT